MKVNHCFIVLFLLLVPIFCYAQDVDEAPETIEGANAGLNEKPLSLQQLADDQKFQNGTYFLTMKKYDKAIEAFYEYLEIYYDGSHRSEVYTNLAGIFFERQDYLRAITLYKNLFEEFSNTEDGIRAFFNMGLCYVKMGYNESALNIFNQILKDYPASPFVAQAKVQMDLLKILEK